MGLWKVVKLKKVEYLSLKAIIKKEKTATKIANSGVAELNSFCKWRIPQERVSWLFIAESETSQESPFCREVL